MTRPVFRAALTLTALLAAFPCVLYAGTVNIGNQAGVHVRGIQEIPNNTGQDANDLHVLLEPKENQNITNGAELTSGDFGTVTATRRSARQIQFDLENGLVPDGDSTELDVGIWIKFKNSIKVTWVWTKDGAPIGAGAQAFRAEDAAPGGGGGDPVNQGGGEGTGNWVHHFWIYNEGNKPMELRDVYFFASMVYYDDLKTIPWGTATLAGPVTIAAGGTWHYAFETTGHYVGGHLYHKYLIDDPVGWIGDHPITNTVPLPTTAWMGLGLLVLLGAARASRKLR